MNTVDEPFRSFEWHVAPAYHWQDWLSASGKRLVVPATGFRSYESPSAIELVWEGLNKKDQKVGPVLGPVLDSGLARTYSPMLREHATLFRTFADLDYQDRAAMLDFATRYGLLGAGFQDQALMFADRTGPDRHHHALGESQLTWAREICLMREGLELSRTMTPREETQDRANWRRVGLEPPYEDRRKKLAWLFDVHLQHVQGRMIVEANVPPRLSFAPLTLLAAMWLQLALSVAGDKEFRACKHCRRLFELSTDETGFRRHREFCSAVCKTQDYRKRKRAALALAQAGGSMAAIAERTDTAKATVRGWLSASKAQSKGKK